MLQHCMDNVLANSIHVHKNYTIWRIVGKEQMLADSILSVNVQASECNGGLQKIGR
jgi:hypothetical protein